MEVICIAVIFVPLVIALYASARFDAHRIRTEQDKLQHHQAHANHPVNIVVRAEPDPLGHTLFYEQCQHCGARFYTKPVFPPISTDVY